MHESAAVALLQPQSSTYVHIRTSLYSSLEHVEEYLFLQLALAQAGVHY